MPRTVCVHIGYVPSGLYLVPAQLRKPGVLYSGVGLLQLGSPQRLCEATAVQTFATSIFGLGRMGFSISMLDFTFAGFSMLARSLA